MSAAAAVAAATSKLNLPAILFLLSSFKYEPLDGDVRRNVRQLLEVPMAQAVEAISMELHRGCTAIGRAVRSALHSDTFRSDTFRTFPLQFILLKNARVESDSASQLILLRFFLGFVVMMPGGLNVFGRFNRPPAIS